LRTELIRVLARYPEARAEVAAVFRQAGLQAATEMGGSPEGKSGPIDVKQLLQGDEDFLRAAL
jgi:hypothetical protein